MRMKGMITNLRSFDCKTNSPCQYLKKCMEKSIENIDTEQMSGYKELKLSKAI